MTKRERLAAIKNIRVRTVNSAGIAFGDMMDYNELQAERPDIIEAIAEAVIEGEQEEGEVVVGGMCYRWFL